MAIKLTESLSEFLNNRWLAFVAATWVQSFAGFSYMFGSISPVIKSSLNYNQKEISILAFSKSFGACLGFVSGKLCEILPMWVTLLIGALQNLLGFGVVWLIVTGKLPVLPLWAMCIFMFIGTNGQTYYNTAALVSCVLNFPRSRGPIVGISKGFAGLSCAIITQLYAAFNFPDRASLIFIIAVAPSMVVISLMFFVRPVGGDSQIRRSDDTSFTFVYSVSLILASYLMAVMLVQDLVRLSHTLIVVFTSVLFFLLISPIVIPLFLSFSYSNDVSNEPLLSTEASSSASVQEAPAGGTAHIEKRNGPRLGEDFTVAEALVKLDFWLMFFALVLGAGTGVTVIDNLGQLSLSLGYSNGHILVSIVSIWNFLGRLGGGYFSERIVQKYWYPRPVALIYAQLMMSVGHVVIGFGWAGALYVGTFMVGIGYGTHWSVVPATISELFGLKKFGLFYNFLLLAGPLGSFVFFSLIASSIYDYEAGKQARGRQSGDARECDGAVCFFATSLIMSGVCVLAALLSLIVVRRTRTVYANLYGNVGL